MHSTRTYPRAHYVVESHAWKTVLLSGKELEWWQKKGGTFFFLQPRALLLISGHKNLGHNCSLPACAQTGGGDSEKKGGNKGKGKRKGGGAWRENSFRQIHACRLLALFLRFYIHA